MLLSVGWGGMMESEIQSVKMNVLQVASRGVPTAEVNLDTSGATNVCQYVFQASFTITTPDGH